MPPGNTNKPVPIGLDDKACYNWAVQKKTISKKQKTAMKWENEKYLVLEYKSFRFRKKHSFEIDVSKNRMGLVRTKFRILKPDVLPTLEAS
ncbi:unnamed protein product [Clavelina lepadiformis]|uniref:Uncharacterized protein n=1 Tax=Clavelina lepadiformis TaxID=159417 RepID=A0ABP0GBS4_CLALP